MPWESEAWRTRRQERIKSIIVGIVVIILFLVVGFFDEPEDYFISGNVVVTEGR